MNARSQPDSQIMLTVGAVIYLLMALVLTRSQQKVDLVLSDLFSDPSHPAKIIDDRASKWRSFGIGTVRRIFGYGVLWLCCVALIIGASLAWTGSLEFAAPKP